MERNSTRRVYNLEIKDGLLQWHLLHQNKPLGMENQITWFIEPIAIIFKLLSSKGVISKGKRYILKAFCSNKTF